MKLIKFNATAVYGYLNPSIKFNEDITFLAGGNGCGKTTIIRLIQSIFSLSVKELNSIPFSSLDLQYTDKGIVNIISANVTEKSIKINVGNDLGDLHLPKINMEEFEGIYPNESERERLLEGGYDSSLMEMREHPVFKYIMNLESPFVLGLERRGLERPVHGMVSERARYISRIPQARRRQFKGTLALGLTETQLMVQDAFKRIKNIHDRNSQELKNKILISSFHYADGAEIFKDGGLRMDWVENSSVLNRRQEIENILNDMGDSGTELSQAIQSFFSKLESLSTQMTSETSSGSINIEWLVNKVQIDRIVNIVKKIDENKEKLNKINAPINKFIKLLNYFYTDSKKKIGIDPIGCLYVTRPDGRQATIEALSSGERQLLIIFTQLIFNKSSSRSGVFIIDEPELSLHLKWQEIMVEKMIEASPNFQVIMATHSPEIIANRESKCVQVEENA